MTRLTHKDLVAQDYQLTYLYFPDNMTAGLATRSLNLFSTEVMPVLAKL